MYEKHFGLSEPPFTLTPNTSFFVGCATHQEALNTLMVAIRSSEGFMKLTGEVGTGKTMICRTILSLIEKQGFRTAFIPNPYMRPNTMLLGVAHELGIDYPSNVNQHQLLKMITEFLVASNAEGRRVVLCLDEAQAMPVETLEALRLLTNLETERQKLIQVVLFGQPELDQHLSDPSIRQLRQRITFSYRLRPMDRKEVDYYVSHRLMRAGYNGPHLFSRSAIKHLHQASGGIPRLVNVLTNKALMAAYGAGSSFIAEKHMKMAIQDTDSVTQPTSRWRTRLARLVAGN